MSITIIDAVVFVMFIVGILVGWRRGLVTEIVAIIGLIAVLVISWLIKSQVSVYFYKYLPFFNFAGPIKGITSLNILLYELLSFCLIITVLGAVLGIIMKVTGLFEKVLRVTVLLSFPSKVMGGIIGFFEAYVIIFVVLCVLSQPFITFVDLTGSKLSNTILSKTPLLSEKVNGVIKSGEEIFDLVKSSKKYTTSELNYKTLDTLLKYDVVEPDSVDYLQKKGKLKISGASALADKYR